MTIEEILETSLDHPDLNKAHYWTNNPTHVEAMLQPDRRFWGYLITHETGHIEVCLTTGAAKAFARCRKTGAIVYRDVDFSMCGEVTEFFFDLAAQQAKGGDTRG